jgi:hypothetical protein
MKKILSVVAASALLFALTVPAFAATPSVTYNVDATLLTTESITEAIQTETPAEQVKTLEQETVVENAAELDEGVKLEVKAITEANDNTLKPEEKTALVEAVQNTLTESIEDVTKSVQKQITSGAVQGVQATNDKGEVVKEVTVKDVAVTLAEINLKDADGKDVDPENFPEGGLKVAIAYGELSNGQAVLDVLRLVDGEWKSVGADNFNYANGKVNVTFDHLCSVAFVIGTVEAVYAPADSGKAEEGGGKSDKETTGKTEKETAASGTATKKDPSKSPQTGYDVIGWTVTVSALVVAAGCCFVSARKVTE